MSPLNPPPPGPTAAPPSTHPSNAERDEPPPRLVNPPAQSFHSKPRIARLLVGPGLRTLYRTPFLGAQIDAAVGTESAHSAWYFRASLFAGSTRYGLAAIHPSLGFLAEGRLSRVRLGVGLQTGMLFIPRVTSNPPLYVITLGPRLAASYDVHDFGDEKLLFVVTELGVDAVLFANTALFEAVLALGARY